MASSLGTSSSTHDKLLRAGEAATSLAQAAFFPPPNCSLGLPFWDGHAGQRIAEILSKLHLDNQRRHEEALQSIW
jgi:hypothetical protein